MDDRRDGFAEPFFTGDRQIEHVTGVPGTEVGVLSEEDEAARQTCGDCEGVAVIGEAGIELKMPSSSSHGISQQMSGEPLSARGEPPPFSTLTERLRRALVSARSSAEGPSTVAGVSSNGTVAGACVAELTFRNGTGVDIAPTLPPSADEPDAIFKLGIMRYLSFHVSSCTE